MERIALFTRLIDAFPKGHPLKRYRGDVYFEVNNFHLLFRIMQREGWTSAFIQQQAEAYLARLESPSAAAEEEWIEKLRAAVHEFDNYQGLLQQLNRYDRGWPAEELPDNGPVFHLLENPVIEKVLLLLNYLAAEQDIRNSGDEMLFELLHAEWFNIPPREILHLTLEVADRQYTQYTTSLRRLLYEKAHMPPRNLFTPAVHEGLKRASQAIEKLTALPVHTPLPSLLENILEETGIAAFITHHPDKAHLEKLVNDFTAYIKEEVQRNPAMDLPLLVKLLLLMRRLALTSTWPPTPATGSIIETLAVLYKPSAPLRVETTTTVTLTATVPETTRPRIAPLDTATENRLLQRFVMNATALNNYLRCPLEFFYNTLIRIPFPRNEATEFGSAVHFALELLFRKMQGNEGVFPAKEAFIKDFEGYLYRSRASFTPEQFNRRLAYGQEVLSNYYDEYVHSWNTIVAVERNIRQVVINGVPLKGKIDKLEFDGRSVNLVDYKTGDPEKSLDRLQPAGEASALGGDYWRQAVFYKILVDNYQQKQWQVTSAEFDFIEPDKKGHYHKIKLFITPGEVATVAQQITTVWQRIQQRNFYTGCGKPYCHWCHFVKTYPLAAAPHE